MPAKFQLMPSAFAASALSFDGFTIVAKVALNPVNATSAVALFLVAEAIKAFTSSRLTPASAATDATRPNWLA